MELIKKLGGRKNKNGKRKSYWGLFLCSYCEEKVERRLSGGKRDKSCGCMALKFISKSSTKHGHCKNYKFSKLYNTWHCMEQRCRNKNRSEYKNYGGRGITICDDWIKFVNFEEWALANGYKEGLEINRIDNNGNYEPGNISFVSHAENNQNKRTNKLDWGKVDEIRRKYEQENYSIKEISDEYKIHYATISDAIHHKTWKLRYHK